MSSDHNQRQMDFILEQQAKFEVAIAKLEDNLARTAEQSRENTANIAKLGEIILSVANYNEDQDEKIAAQDRQIAAHDRQIAANEKQIAANERGIAALIEHSLGLDVRIAELIEHGMQNDVRIAELIEHGKEADERITDLAKAVQRCYEGNGK